MKRDWLLPIGSLIQFALLLPLARWAHKYQQPLSELVVTRLRQRKQTSATRSVVNVLNTLKGISRKTWSLAQGQPLPASISMAS